MADPVDLDAVKRRQGHRLRAIPVRCSDCGREWPYRSNPILPSPRCPHCGSQAFAGTFLIGEAGPSAEDDLAAAVAEVELLRAENEQLEHVLLVQETTLKRLLGNDLTGKTTGELATFRAEVERVRVAHAQLLDELTVLHNTCGRYEDYLMRLRAENDQLRADAKMHAMRGEEPRD